MNSRRRMTTKRPGAVNPLYVDGAENPSRGVCVMSDSEDYRVLADQCLAMANDPKISKAERKSLVKMAAVWKQLAADAAQREARDLPSPN
jgi:hypothetical protein